MTEAQINNAHPIWIDHSPSRLVRVLKFLAYFASKNPIAVFGAVIILLLIATAVAAPWLAPHSYDDISLSERLQGPSTSHWFGTDETGRDQLSRIIYGARISVLVGFGATLIAIACATLLGVLSGYFGGWFDTILQRFIEVWQSFPGLVFLIFVVSIFSASLLTVTLTIGALFTAGASRIIRSSVLSIRGQAYIESAVVIGASRSRIILVHVLPNIIPVIIVTASIQIGAVILTESALAFLGFGVPPPYPSWGLMLNNSQRFMQAYPYLAVFPGLAISLVVFSFNMLGDGIRDIMDPRFKK